MLGQRDKEIETLTNGNNSLHVAATAAEKERAAAIIAHENKGVCIVQLEGSVVTLEARIQSLEEELEESKKREGTLTETLVGIKDDVSALVNGAVRKYQKQVEELETVLKKEKKLAKRYCDERNEIRKHQCLELEGSKLVIGLKRQVKEYELQARKDRAHWELELKELQQEKEILQEETAQAKATAIEQSQLLNGNKALEANMECCRDGVANLADWVRLHTAGQNPSISKLIEEGATLKPVKVTHSMFLKQRTDAEELVKGLNFLRDALVEQCAQSLTLEDDPGKCGMQ